MGPPWKPRYTCPYARDFSRLTLQLAGAREPGLSVPESPELETARIAWEDVRDAGIVTIKAVVIAIEVPLYVELVPASRHPPFGAAMAVSSGQCNSRFNPMR
jgi:hypothetical protein